MNQVEDYINKQTCFQCFLILRINKLNATTTPEKVCILQRFSSFFSFSFLCMNIKGSLNFLFFLTKVIEKVLLLTLSGLQASIYF